MPRRGPAVLHELVEHPRPAGGSRLVLLLGPRVVVGERRDGVPAEPEPDLLPPLVELAEHPVGRHAQAVDEHEVLTTVGQVVQRTELEPRGVGRGEEVADALVALRGVRIGAGGDDHPVAVVAGRAERLLAVDHPLLAVGHRARPERRQIRTGVGLGVALGPHDLARRHAGQERGLLLLGAQAQDRRAHLHADAGEAAGTPAIELLLHHTRLARRHLRTAVLARPRGLEPTLRPLLLPELAVEGPPVGILLEVPLEPLELRRELVVEPRPHLVAQDLEPGRRRQRDVHRLNLFRTRRGAPPRTVAVVQMICGRERVQGAGRLRLGRTSHHGEAHCETARAAAGQGVRPAGASARSKKARRESGNYPMPDRDHAISAIRRSERERRRGNLTKDEFERINRKARKILRKKKRR